MRECSATTDIAFLSDGVRDGAGGKAGNLILLKSLGVNVPNAFVLTARFFDGVAAKSGLDIFIRDALNGLNKRNVKRISQSIRDKIMSLEIDRADEIYDFFDRAGFSRVAVRSSAIGEDGEENAFAGMLDSFLDADRQNLLECVKRCLCSLYNERCLLYTAAKNIAHPSMAVIVQQMIHGDHSGVLFSRNPVTCADEFVIEYAEGVGDSLVSGRITPDRAVLCRDGRAKEVTNENSYGKISAYIGALCADADKLKNFYGYDVDIEFSVTDGKVYFLQCRPITSPQKNDLIGMINSRETTFYVKREFCFLFESFQKQAFDSALQNKILGFELNTDNYAIINGKEYYDTLDHDADIAKFDELYINNNAFFEQYAAKIFGIITDAEIYTDRMKTEKYSDITDARLAKKLIEFEQKYLTAIVPTFARPDDYLERKLSEIGLTEEQIKTVSSAAAYYPERYAPLAYTEAIRSIKSLAEKYYRGDDIACELNVHIEKYAWMKAPLCEKLGRFTKVEYRAEIEELARVRNFERRDETERGQALAAAEKILFGKPEAKRIFDAVRNFVYLRTKLSETSDRMFYVFRTTLLKETGKRIGLTDRDTVTLSAAEIEERLLFGTDHSDRIKSRRRGYCLLKRDGKWFEAFGNDAKRIIENFENAHKQSNDKNAFAAEISGTVATRGYAVGKVRIIKNGRDLFAVKQGDIVVSSMTTPEYIFAIEKAGGFITDEGGITCHAAVISREFGIPCIVGTKNATERLKNGQTVALDAINGTVEIFD